MPFWSPTTARRASPLDVAAIALLALLVLVLFLDRPQALPQGGQVFTLSPALLPWYALRSFLRMLAAYVLSLGFSLVVGYWAATSLQARRFIMPCLDILQSVPILGFFPAAVFLFIRLFNGSVLGVEAAAVFLIFTSQAWNLAFSVYESLTTIPEDLATAVAASGASGMVRWRRLLLPACVPRLTYNSMMSWAAGWYFLIASEVITVGPQSYTLPGLGSYIGTAIEHGDWGLATAGIGTLAALIVLLHIFVWSPLGFWSRRFRYEFSSRTEAVPTPAAITLISRAPLVRRAWHRTANQTARIAGAVAAVFSFVFTLPVTRFVLGALALAAAVGIGYGGVRTAITLIRPLPPAAAGIPLALLYSFLRLVVAYAISLAWTIPLAYWLSRSAQRAARVLPIVQILASMPATAFFPLIVAAIIGLHLSMNVAAVVLILTGMQWYLLLNLVAGAEAMPEDLRELAAASNVGGWMYLRRFFLPVAMPSLITGSITAWGGGWNALIIAEYVTANGRVYSTPGIGSLLDRFTYVDGNLQMIVLSILTMVVVVTALNRLVWRRLYEVAAVRFRLEY
ncbi:MAG: ABC transporter permease subunit [Acidobacteriota bacterium]|nr:ABC transporter permease subunit [Acidobacteriota bacterium]